MVAARAWSAVGFVVVAEPLRLNPGPPVVTARATGVKVALPVTRLAGAAHSTLVVGARWEPMRLPRTLRGPAPASTAVGEGAPACNQEQQVPGAREVLNRVGHDQPHGRGC